MLALMTLTLKSIIIIKWKGVFLVIGNGTADHLNLLCFF